MSSSVHHSFDISVATDLKSVDLAILLHHIQFWIVRNKRLKKNQHDGKTWMYQTIHQMASSFPYWSKKQVERLLIKAVEEGILLKGNFNNSSYDRTCWYSFVNEDNWGISRFREMDEPESGNQNPEIGTPIPDTKTDTEKDVVCIASQVDKKKVKEEERKRILEAAEKGNGLPSEVSKQHPDGRWQSISLQNVFSEAIKNKKDWSTDEIHDAWKILLDYSGYIREPIRYLDGTITKIRNSKRSEYLERNKKDLKWTKTKTKSEDCKETSSDNDTSERHSLQWYLDRATEKESQVG